MICSIHIDSRVHAATVWATNPHIVDYIPALMSFDPELKLIDLFACGCHWTFTRQPNGAWK